MKIQDAKDDAFNRKMLEKKESIILMSPEANRKDKLKSLDSGLNEILCRIAARNKSRIGIDINEIKGLSRLEKAKRLARIAQNIKLCRKTNALLFITSSQRSARSLVRSLGGSTKQASSTETQSF